MNKVFNSQTNLYLIGPMGSGKSSIGFQLAKLSRRAFFDSDNAVEQRSGVSISWIFEKEREAGFRYREAAVLQELCQHKGIVLATGGGSILNEENRKLLDSTGIVIYLQVTMPEQLTRTKLRKSVRPLLQNNVEETLKQLYQERSPLYETIADLTINTDQEKPFNIAKNIWRQLCLNQH